MQTICIVRLVIRVFVNELTHRKRETLRSCPQGYPGGRGLCASADAVRPETLDDPSSIRVL